MRTFRYVPGLETPDCLCISLFLVLTLKLEQDSDPDCMRQDEVLYRIADKVKNFAVVSLSILHAKNQTICLFGDM